LPSVAWQPLTPGTGLKPCGPGDRFCLPPGGVLFALRLLTDELALDADLRFRRLFGCRVVSGQGKQTIVTQRERILNFRKYSSFMFLD